MSDDPPTPPPAGGEAGGAVAPTVLPPPAPAPPPLLRRTPRRGETTPGWRFVVAGLWAGVALAFAAIWGASVQLGLPTWWLSPRYGPGLLRLVPFVPAVVLVIAALNHARWLCWWGVAGAALLALVAVGDFRRVSVLAGVELAVALAAGIGSLAALAGTYRRRTDPPVAAAAPS